MIKQYLEYQKLRTNAPPKFGKHLIIQTVGHALGRKSINNLAPFGVRHNMYLCIIAPSSKSRKTTAQDICTDLIPYEHTGVTSCSPEGLLTALGDNSDVICPFGEFSQILRSISQGGHMARLQEITNDLFGCKTYTKKLVMKMYVVKNPYLSISTTITPEQFEEFTKPEMYTGGFLARYVLCISDAPPWEPRNKLPPNIEKIGGLLRAIIRELYLQCKASPITFELDDEAQKYLNKISKEVSENKDYDEIFALAERTLNYVVAYADILFVCDLLEEHIFKGLSIKKTLAAYETNNNNETYETSNSSISKDVYVHLHNNIPLQISRVLQVLYVLEAAKVPKRYVEQAWLLLEKELKMTAEFVSLNSEQYYVKKLLRTLKYFYNNNETTINKSKILAYSKLTAKQYMVAFDTLFLRDEIIQETFKTGGRTGHNIKMLPKLLKRFKNNK